MQFFESHFLVNYGWLAEHRTVHPIMAILKYWRTRFSTVTLQRKFSQITKTPQTKNFLSGRTMIEQTKFPINIIQIWFVIWCSFVKRKQDAEIFSAFQLKEETLQSSNSNQKMFEKRAKLIQTQQFSIFLFLKRNPSSDKKK